MISSTNIWTWNIVCHFKRRRNLPDHVFGQLSPHRHRQLIMFLPLDHWQNQLDHSLVLQNMVTRHNAGAAWPLPPKKIQLRILPKARHHRRQILPDVTWQLPQRSRQQATKKRLSHLDVARLSFKCCSPPSPGGTSRSTVVVAQPFFRQLIQVSSHL